jgi:hypothetical protein
MTQDHAKPTCPLCGAALRAREVYETYYACGTQENVDSVASHRIGRFGDSCVQAVIETRKDLASENLVDVVVEDCAAGRHPVVGESLREGLRRYRELILASGAADERDQDDADAADEPDEGETPHGASPPACDPLPAGPRALLTLYRSEPGRALLLRPGELTAAAYLAGAGLVRYVPGSQWRQIALTPEGLQHLKRADEGQARGVQETSDD